MEPKKHHTIVLLTLLTFSRYIRALMDSPPPPPVLLAAHDVHDVHAWIFGVAFAYLVAPSYTRSAATTTHNKLYSGTLRNDHRRRVLRVVSRAFLRGVDAHTHVLYKWMRQREHWFNQYTLFANTLDRYTEHAGFAREAYQHRLPHHKLCENEYACGSSSRCPTTRMRKRRQAFTWLVPQALWDARAQETRAFCTRMRLCHASTTRAFDDAQTCSDCGGWYTSPTTRCVAVHQEKRVHAHMHLCRQMGPVHDELLRGVTVCTFPCCRQLVHTRVGTALLCGTHRDFEHVMRLVVRPSTWTLLRSCGAT